VNEQNNFYNSHRNDDRDRLHEECGVFGIYDPRREYEVARVTFFGLYALQHRGQESAGIATADGKPRLRVRTSMGLVAHAFNETDLAELSGHIAIGHTRYSTSGSSVKANAQPIVVSDSDLGPLAIAHNGNVVNAAYLSEELGASGVNFDCSTDSEVIAKLIVSMPGRTWTEKIRAAMGRISGAYALVLLTPTALYAVRDPLGVRPLCMGRFDNGGWAFSSESCALQTVGAQIERELEPGEIVCIDAEGEHRTQFPTGERKALCSFEYIYFARPDSVINGRSLYTVRTEMGRQLAREHPADADVVIPVPDTAWPAAIGYAQEAGLPFAEGLIKNRYIGRTFIQPDQRLRSQGVALKFNPLPEVLRGKRVVMVDDSIVRGTTTPPLVALLRQAGAKEVHVRIHSPEMVNPCYLGVDTARSDELIAANMSVAQICQHIGADSLGYLSIAGLKQAIGLPERSNCFACFNGEYPVPVQMEMSKLTLEARRRRRPSDEAIDVVGEREKEEAEALALAR